MFCVGTPCGFASLPRPPCFAKGRDGGAPPWEGGRETGCPAHIQILSGLLLAGANASIVASALSGLGLPLARSDCLSSSSI